MIKLKKTVCVAVAVLIAVSAVACQKAEAPEDNVASADVKAMVNGEAITKSEYEQVLSINKKSAEMYYGSEIWDTDRGDGTTFGSYFEDQILEELILNKLMLAEAVREGFTMTDDEIKSEFDEVKNSYSSEDEYKKAVEEVGFTEDFILKDIKETGIINKYRENIISKEPTEDELKELYDKIHLGEELKASHILVDTEEEAKTVLERLKAGETFEDVAKEVSTCPSAPDGGDLGFFSYTSMVKEFSDAAFAMNVGDLSDIVKSDFGYHVIKVTDKKGEPTPYEEAGETLKDMYKSNLYNDKIAELKADAKIEKY